MKGLNRLLILLIAVFLAVFFGYRQYDAMHADTQPPEISIDDTHLLRLSVSDPKGMLLQGVTALDDQDGDVSAKLVVESVQMIDENGLVEVVYAAVDQSANVTKRKREVQYTDYEGPKFSLNAPLVYLEHGSFDIMSDLGAYDVLDGDIQHRIRATSLTEDAISNVGTHYVYFQVTNSLGDTSELIIPVEVLQSDTYEATLTLTDYLVYLKVGSPFRAEAYLDTFQHRDEETVLRYGLPQDYSLRISGEVDMQTEGVYPVEFRVTYTVRHATNPDYDQEFTGFSKLIVVVEE